MTQSVRRIIVGAVLLLLPASLCAQSFEGPGTRAQGMGAFVAVADDASAVYWNPAGLASGAFFSLVLDRTDARAAPAGDQRAGSRSAWLLALSAPAVGLSYYRLRSLAVVPSESSSVTAGNSRVESLVTHHAGATLVQSIFRSVAVGATVKLVRGIATTDLAAGTAEQILDGWELMGVASNHFDVDVGIMGSMNLLRAGVTVRNLTRPGFATAGDEELHLDRQVRAGVALVLTRGWTAAADLDVTRNRGPLGDIRTFAVGAEGRVAPRAVARAGLQLNTAGDRGRSPIANLGASYAALRSLLIDAHISAGSEHGFGGWGIAGRVAF